MTVVGSQKMVVYDDVSADARIRLYDKGVTRTRIADGGPPAELGRYETFAEFQLLLRAGDVLIPEDRVQRTAPGRGGRLPGRHPRWAATAERRTDRSRRRARPRSRAAVARPDRRAGRRLTVARQPRVVILVENLPVPLDRRVWLEARTLRDAGWQVVVISPQGGPGMRRLRQRIEGIDVLRYPQREATGAAGYLAEYLPSMLFSLVWLLWARADRAGRRHPRLQSARPVLAVRTPRSTVGGALRLRPARPEPGAHPREVRPPSADRAAAPSPDARPGVRFVPDRRRRAGRERDVP